MCIHFFDPRHWQFVAVAFLDAGELLVNGLQVVLGLRQFFLRVSFVGIGAHLTLSYFTLLGLWLWLGIGDIFVLVILEFLKSDGTGAF